MVSVKVKLNKLVSSCQDLGLYWSHLHYSGKSKMTKMINNLFTLKQAFAALASFAARLLGKFGYREDY